MTLFELSEKFPSEQAARDWFELLRWEGNIRCGHCQSEKTKSVPKEKPMPYWCSDCKKYFSVRTGTPMAASNLPLKKWAYAFYLMTVHPKRVPSIQMAKPPERGCVLLPSVSSPLRKRPGSVIMRVLHVYDRYANSRDTRGK